MLNAKKLAMTFSNNSYNILIYGESGVGKELFAQSIHNYSERRNKPFVSINCASVSPELIDSELFGYTSGAFTGASKGGQVGKFELAAEEHCSWMKLQKCLYISKQSFFVPWKHAKSIELADQKLQLMCVSLPPQTVPWKK